MHINKCTEGVETQKEYIAKDAKKDMQRKRWIELHALNYN